jgi:uncharacterized membrane protein YcfT
VSDHSWFGSAIGLFVGSVIVLAVFAPQLIPLDVNLFIYFLVDHIQGMVVGALIGAFLGGKTTILGIPVGAILGTIGQYLLLH